MLTAGKCLLGTEWKEDRAACLFVRKHRQNTYLQRILTALTGLCTYLLLALGRLTVKINV